MDKWGLLYSILQRVQQNGIDSDIFRTICQMIQHQYELLPDDQLNLLLELQESKNTPNDNLSINLKLFDSLTRKKVLHQAHIDFIYYLYGLRDNELPTGKNRRQQFSNLCAYQRIFFSDTQNERVFYFE